MFEKITKWNILFLGIEINKIALWYENYFSFSSVLIQFLILMMSQVGNISSSVLKFYNSALIFQDHGSNKKKSGTY